MLLLNENAFVRKTMKYLFKNLSASVNKFRNIK